MRRLGAVIALPLVALVVAGSAAGATRDARVAALQVALRANGLYNGDVDGLSGPRTERAVRTLQAKAKISVDGVVGPQTRKALGRLGRPGLGTRTLKFGKRGWDVASLQFRLAEHGFPSGTFDGVFGPRTDDAVRRFQEWAGLPVDGHAGRATYRALTMPAATSPLNFKPPLFVPHTDPFGPRGVRFHTGVDFPAPHGTPVLAARTGRVTIARWLDGYGYTIVVRHTLGVSTMYAHLSAFVVRDGEAVAVGQPIGRVGASGSATGPHLHFEVRVRGAAVDPLPSLR
jgi:peptidoglycan hydrolase-like protein with peptidoglycan-binding domain